MSIKLIVKNGSYLPTFFCDVCDRKVEQIAGKPKPRYAYDHAQDGAAIDPVYIICGPECHNEIDRQHGKRLSWIELDKMVINLWANMELDWRELAKTAKRMSEGGI